MSLWFRKSWRQDEGRRGRQLRRNRPAKEPLEGRVVLRGGGWGSIPLRSRSADRSRDAPENRSSHVGFRVARVQSSQ
jgi:formylglycine-generating enzyme required for sulfatase activity